jgi:hypothetical protein
VAWLLGVAFLVALLGVLFLYDGRDSTSKPTASSPGVVNPAGSK